MKAIVAVDSEWGIGKDNKLLFSIPEDMKFFREKTTGKVVVMGKNTLLSFPAAAPLKNRVNVVLSSTLERDDVKVASDMEKLKVILKSYPPDDVFVIGGGKVYESLLPYCDEAFVTKVDAKGEADAFFENLDLAEGWSLASESRPVSTNGYTVRFTVYENNKVKIFA